MGKTIVPTVSFLFLRVLIRSLCLQLPGREEPEPGAGEGGPPLGGPASPARPRSRSGFCWPPPPPPPRLSSAAPPAAAPRPGAAALPGAQRRPGVSDRAWQPPHPPPAPSGQTPQEPQARSPSPSSSSPPVPSAAAPSAAAAPSPAPAPAAPWGPGDSLSGQEAASRPSAPQEGACHLAAPPVKAGAACR